MKKTIVLLLFLFLAVACLGGCEEAAHTHTAGKTVEENVFASRCDGEGYFDEIVYCADCGGEISRERKTTPPTGHIPAEAVQENILAAGCETEGGYDEVIRCTDCGTELSRERKTSQPTHKAGEVICEELTPATCLADGEMEEYVSCTECGWILAHRIVASPALGHDREMTVEKPLDCTREGGATVISCIRCNEVFSRTPKAANELHPMEGGVCTACDMPESTPGLAFSINAGGRDYTVTGIGTAQSADLVIGVYQGLTVNRIGDAAFREDDIHSLVLGNGVWYIGIDAFYYNDLVSVDLGKGVRKIEALAFYGSNKLTEIVFPDSLTEIERMAFRNCPKLKKVSFGSGLKTIESYAFYECSAMEDLALPASLDNLEIGAFYGLKSLKNISIDAKNRYYSVKDGVLYDKMGWELILFPAARKEAYFVVPDKVQTIGFAAFRQCSLLSVLIPGSVHTIEEEAFAESASLGTVVLSEGLSRIGKSAFANCKFSEITLPASVRFIAPHAFDIKKLSEVTLTQPEGWFWTKEESAATGRKPLDAAALSDPSTAVYYFCSRYKNVYWHRKSE